MISKSVLKQYIDLQEEIKETEERIKKTEKQIEKIEREGTVIDSVTGGNGGIQRYKIEGFPYMEYGKLKERLYMRKATLQSLENELIDKIAEVELFIASIEDSRMRRIISFRFIDGMTWDQVGINMGGGNNAENMKKAFYRFMEENKTCPVCPEKK